MAPVLRQTGTIGLPDARKCALLCEPTGARMLNGFSAINATRKLGVRSPRTALSRSGYLTLWPCIPLHYVSFSTVLDGFYAAIGLACADPKRLVSPDELIAMGIKLPRAKFPPGKGSLYSSLNTIVLGRILENITGESFDALLSERLLKPLALHRTKLDTDGNSIRPSATAIPTSAGICRGSTDTSGWPQFSFAAGALASTLSDLHQWGIALGEGFGLTPALRQARIDDELGIAIQREHPGGRVNLARSCRLRGRLFRRTYNITLHGRSWALCQWRWRNW